jgi:hypothetical protein
MRNPVGIKLFSSGSAGSSVSVNLLLSTIWVRGSDWTYKILLCTILHKKDKILLEDCFFVPDYPFNFRVRVVTPNFLPINYSNMNFKMSRKK